MAKLTEKDIWANTPCFVLNKNDLEANLIALKQALNQHWPNYTIGYSYKTCAFAWLLQYMKKNGVKAEVVSPEEFVLAKKIGHKTKDIIYNGPIKTKETLTEAMLANSIVNLDAQREIVWAKEIADEYPDINFSLGLRVNFDLGGIGKEETVAGKSGNRFGFSLEKGYLENAIQQLQECERIKVNGLHMHISSKTRSINIYKKLAEKAVQVTNKFNLQLEYIDIGGGFFAGGDFNDKFDLYIKTIAEELSKQYKTQELTLIVEPGAALIASPISLYSRVIDVKENFNERLVVTDASRCLIDPFMHKSSYQYEHISHYNNEYLQTSLENFIPQEVLTSDIEKNKHKESQQISKQIICGYTCMENDRLMKIADSQEILAGDGLIYNTVGSYTLCFNPLFIRYLPDIFLEEDDEISLIRRRWQTDEFLIGNMINMSEDASDIK